MKNTLIQTVATQEADLLALREPRQALLPASLGWLSSIENAFVRWQAKRLAEIPAERLWAQAMQDTRSFAEIRRSAR